jgi:hypothetical protein
MVLVAMATTDARCVARLWAGPLRGHAVEDCNPVRFPRLAAITGKRLFDLK